jgi:nucleotide-binding universal stress UspA family protein
MNRKRRKKFMRAIKKIIWPTDGSKESEEALNYAKFLAQRFNSEIIGVYVIEMHKKLLYDYARDPDSELYRWVEKAAESHKARLASIADELVTQGLRFRVEVLIGEPDKEIIRFTRGVKADLIVMGKRGLGLIDRILIGSNTLKVLRESSVPVLAVKKRNEEGIIDVRNILVPLDVYEKVDSALNYAVDLAVKIKANISVVYAFRLDTYAPLGIEISPNIIANLIDELQTFTSTELAKRVDEAKLKLKNDDKETDKLEINTEVIQGISPSMRIVEYATSKNTDLIVMNTHGRKGIKRFILGSVAEKIIQESPCPVLALKP